MPDQADALLSLKSCNERAEAVASDFVTWLGPQLAELLLELAAKETEASRAEREIG